MANFFSGINLKVIIFTFIVVSITAASSAFLPYKQQKKELAEKLSAELLGIVKTAAVTIDHQEHENIFYNPDYGLDGRDEFNKIKTLLINTSDINGLDRRQGLSPIYTLRPSLLDSTKLEFVTMTDRNHKGRFYTGALINKQPFHKQVLKGESQTTGIYEDTEGLWITAAAPIKDNTGKVIGIIQADRPIDFYYIKLSELKNNFILGALLGLLLGFIVAFVFSKRAIEPIKTLLYATRKFTDGDHTFKINEKRTDEFGELFLSFNLMSENLSKTLKELNNKNKELESYALEMQSMALFAKLNPGPVLRVNSKGNIQKINLPARSAFNLNDDNFPTANISTYINNLQSPVLTDIIKYNKHENYIINIDNKWLHFVVRGVEEFEFANMYGTDITDLIAAKEKAKQAQKEAELADQAKTRFLETMSHELLTPMNTIKGYIQLTERKNKDASLLTYINKISQSSFHLLELINNILDFSKIKSNNLDIIDNPFDARELTNKVLEIFTAQFQDNDIDLFIYIDPNINEPILGDKIRIEQIIINLISNALKFTQKGSVVFSIDSTDKGICFSIEDSGMGIDKTYLSNVFFPFTQADASSARKYDGAGLGLSLSQRLAQKMNAAIHIKTEVDKGTHVSFTLPFKSNSPTKQTNLNKNINIYTDFQPTFNYLNKVISKLTLNNSNTIEIIDLHSDSNLIKTLNKHESTSKKLILLLPIGTPIKNISSDTITLKKPITSNTIINALNSLSNADAPHINLAQDNHDNWEIECWGETVENSLEDNLEHAYNKENINNHRIDNTTYSLEEEMKTPFITKENGTFNFGLARGLMSQMEYKESLRLFINCCNVPLIDQPIELLTPIFKNSTLLLACPDLSELADTIFNHEDSSKIRNEIDKHEHNFQLLSDKMLLSCMSELENMNDNENDNNTTQLIDGFDTASAIKRMGGKQDRYIKMLNLFFESYNNNRSETRNFLKENKPIDAKRIAHSIKGAAATIGALELQETAKIAESELAQTQTLSDASLALLEQHLEASLTKINAYINANKPLSEKSP